MAALASFTDRSRSGQVKYSLTFVNNSSNDWSFLCFQNQPTGLPQGYVNLAWFAKAVAHGFNSSATFTWSVDYCMIWSEQGTLADGVVFEAQQNAPADLSTTNLIEFTKLGNGAFTFENQGPGVAGTLGIKQDGNIPQGSASVGVGMAGFGTYAVPAQPNILASFTPTPTYYVAYGQSIQESEVMNISQFTETPQILFPPNNFGAIATLNADNTFTIKYTPDAVTHARAAEKLVNSLVAA